MTCERLETKPLTTKRRKEKGPAPRKLTLQVVLNIFPLVYSILGYTQRMKKINMTSRINLPGTDYLPIAKQKRIELINYSREGKNIEPKKSPKNRTPTRWTEKKLFV